MACILNDSFGDGMRSFFPHKAGECCGNVLRKDITVSSDGSVTIINKGVLSSLCLPFGDKEVKLRIGKLAKDSEKLGFIGLYLVEDYLIPEDHPHRKDIVEIETDMLQEEVVSGERLADKPIDFEKIRRGGLSAARKKRQR